jgi:hypothetical protein
MGAGPLSPGTYESVARLEVSCAGVSELWVEHHAVRDCVNDSYCSGFTLTNVASTLAAQVGPIAASLNARATSVLRREY